MFSSTAAVYGEPEKVPIDETAPTRPTSPYGASKVAVDTALAEYARMYGLGAISLRYFNVAGAYPEAGPREAGRPGGGRCGGSGSGTRPRPTSSPTCSRWPSRWPAGRAAT